MSDLKEKFLYQVLLGISQVLFPLITFPYLTRILGPTGIGKVNFVDYVNTLFIAFASVGLSYYGVREVAKQRDNKDALEQVSIELVTINLIATLILTIPYLLFFQSIRWLKDDSLLILLGCSSFLFSTFLCDWLIQGIEAFKFIALRTILLRIVSIIAIYIFIQNESQYISYYAIIVLVQFLTLAINIHFVKKYLSLKFHRVDFKRHLKPLKYFFLTTTLVGAFVYFDTIILGFFGNDQVVGYYTTAIKLIKLPLVFILSLNTVLFPRISNLTAKQDIGSINYLINTSISFILFMTIPLGIGFYILAPELIYVIAGESFAPSISAVRILAFLPTAIGLNSLFIYQILVPNQLERRVAYAVGVTAIISISLNLIFIPVYMQNGAALATIIAEYSLTVISYLFIRKFCHLKLFAKELLHPFLASSAIIVLLILLKQIVVSPIVVLITGSLLSIICYLVIMKQFKNQSFNAILVYVKSKMVRA